MPFRADSRWKRCGVTMLGSAKRSPPHRLILLTFLSRFLMITGMNCLSVWRGDFGIVVIL